MSLASQRRVLVHDVAAGAQLLGGREDQLGGLFRPGASIGPLNSPEGGLRRSLFRCRASACARHVAFGYIWKLNMT